MRLLTKAYPTVLQCMETPETWASYLQLGRRTGLEYLTSLGELPKSHLFMHAWFTCTTADTLALTYKCLGIFCFFQPIVLQ